MTTERPMIEAQSHGSRPRETFGAMLRHWRKRRNLTQLALALESNVSTRHLSFLETSRSYPSREMVIALSKTLDVPLAERNAMLLAAGLAPAYRTKGLAGADAEPVRKAIALMLRNHLPYPALVVDAGWNIVIANSAYLHFMAWLSDSPAPEIARETLVDTPPFAGSNVLVPLFEPGGLGGKIENFFEVAGLLYAELRHSARDSNLARATLEAIEATGAVPSANHAPLRGPVVSLALRSRGQRLALFSTMTMLGMSTDTVLADLRMEAYFPADEESESLLRKLGGDVGG